jgi:hypothetical protein
MVEISVIASALASLKAMKDIAQAMVGLRDSAAFQEKVIEFQSKILDAQSAISALQEERSVLIERIRTLEEEVTKAKAWDAEKQRYQLQAVDRGAFAYVLKPEVQGSEPPHWLCANCYSKGHKSFLQSGTDDPNVAQRMAIRAKGSRLRCIKEPIHLSEISDS